MLAGIAARTSTLTLGLLVGSVTYRNPALAAKITTTLDVISRGRAWHGIGAGWFQEEHTAYGIEFPTLKERFERLEEALQITRSMFVNEQTTFAGTYFSAHGAFNNPKPIRGDIPILIGGSGERRTLRTTARFAQHWNFVGGPPEEFARKRDVLHAHCRDIGRDPAEIVLSSHVRLGPNGEIGPAIDTAAALGDLGLDLAIVVLPPPHDPAVLAPLADALAQLR